MKELWSLLNWKRNKLITNYEGQNLLPQSGKCKNENVKKPRYSLVDTFSHGKNGTNHWTVMFMACMRYPYRDLDYSGYHKTKSNCFIMHSMKQKSSFYFFTDGKQEKASKLDTITLTNHAPRSYRTWLPVTLSVLDMIIV